jgi:hypothetical protein
MPIFSQQSAGNLRSKDYISMNEHGFFFAFVYVLTGKAKTRQLDSAPG